MLKGVAVNQDGVTVAEADGKILVRSRGLTRRAPAPA